MENEHLPLPPATDPPPSDYDATFGRDAAWRDPAGPARAAAAAAREAAAAAAATPQPHAPQEQAGHKFFQYDDQEVLYRPNAQPKVDVPSASQGTQGQQPTGQAPAMLEFVTPSGFRVQADPAEVAKRYSEYETLREKAQQAEALRNWAAANPDRAAVIERVVRGEDLNAIAESRPADDDDESDTARTHDPRIRALEARAQALEAELTLARKGTIEEQAKQQSAEALDSVPFTKTAPAPVRDAVLELAQLDYARYKHEGITLADAVRKRAASFEAGYRERLQAASTTPPVPTPITQDRQAPSSVTTRRPPQRGLGLTEYLAQFSAK